MKMFNDMKYYIASEWNDCGGGARHIRRPDYRRFCSRLLLCAAFGMMNVTLLVLLNNYI